MEGLLRIWVCTGCVGRALGERKGSLIIGDKNRLHPHPALYPTGTMFRKGEGSSGQRVIPTIILCKTKKEMPLWHRYVITSLFKV